MTLPARNSPIAVDVLDEGERLAIEAERAGVPLRLLGGVAIHLRSRRRIPAQLARAPDDIDVIVARGTQREVGALLAELGYRPDDAFNRFESRRRMLFHDDEHGRRIDVFVHEFEMCHTLPLAERLLAEPATLPLAELALTKLQIVELNPKDRSDLYALLHAHDVGEDDGPTLNAGRVAELCADDWGLWRTSTMNLVRLRDGLGAAALDAADRARVRARVDRLERRIDATPKSRRWRMRARVGERVRWFKTPDEIGEH